MGANMARRLHEQGFPVTTVYDVNAAGAKALAEELGTQASPSLHGVTAAADVIITVVTDDTAQRGIFTNAEDNLLTGAAGKLFLNCATVSPQVHVEIEALTKASGAHSLETCMASSITQARQGTLYLMCAGQREAYDQALPVLEALSAARRFLGQAGTAGRVKALVNLVMNINTAGLAEGLGLGQALGLDLTMLREVFSETGAASRVLQTDGTDMQNRDHDCFFSAAHAAKDTGIALALGKTAGLSLPLSEATLAQYDKMVQLGLGELDKSGVAELTFSGRTVVR
jgi:3-hydroxyisobutyrate dehydrogenase